MAVGRWRDHARRGAEQKAILQRQERGEWQKRKDGKKERVDGREGKERIEREGKAGNVKMIERDK